MPTRSVHNVHNGHHSRPLAILISNQNGGKRQNRSANFIVILWEIISGKAMSKSHPVTIAAVDGGILQRGNLVVIKLFVV